jgi:hypothetical protein
VAKEKKQKEVINGVRIRRSRKDSFKFKAGDIYNRVKTFADKWENDRSTARFELMQRHAKFRQWTEGKNWPWADSSDIKLPDMTGQSLRVQDTLHIAVMSARPPVTARATDKVSSERAEKVDQVIDHQLFVDMNGENFISELTETFTNDGHFVAFIPWVKERAQVSDALMFPQIPEDVSPEEYFKAIISKNYPTAVETVSKGKEFWDWSITNEDTSKMDVSFYTDDNGVEMVTTKFANVFDGPAPMVKDWESVLFPVRAANLQPPSPSNPRGAQAVILVDYPTVDEVVRLQKKGWYDGLTDEDVKGLTAVAPSSDHDDTDRAKDTFDGVSGTETNPQTGAESHKQLTRYTCFDRFDINGDGLDEDVIWWVIRELSGKVAKAVLMTEMYPFPKPRRPLATASFIPIKGRVGGISQLELTEGTHDAMKITYDQMIDSTTITNSPFFFYRAAGGMRPEVIRLAPGEGYPLMDPSRDVHFPQMNNQAGVMGANTIGLLNNMQERLTLVGDQQLGRVPPGGATALRTVTGMAMMQNNAEARPERILRRFYMGLRDIYSMIHELNQIFLPKDKKILIAKSRSKEDEPYSKIESVQEIRGSFSFDFDANAFNTSRQALEQAMTVMMDRYISDINLQLGIIDQEGIYRLQRDWGKVMGQDPDQYLSPPSPDATMRKLFVEDVLLLVAQGQKPYGVPAEGAAAHLQKLQEFIQSDDFGHLPPQHVAELLKPYMEQVAQRAQQEQVQAQQQAAAGQNNASPAAQSPGAPQENPMAMPTNVQDGQLVDQTLPGLNGNGSGNPQ